MLLIDARRLTGPNHLSRTPLVIVEVALESPEAPAHVLEVYRDELARMRGALGLPERVETVLWTHKQGAVIGYEAPIDTMLSCTEMSEWAAESACAVLAGRDPIALEPKRVEIAAMLERDRNESLIALVAEAKRRGLPLLWDDTHTSVGLGHRSICFENRSIPPLDEVPWDTLGVVPVALVTGTNGKTTSSRLLACIAKQTGLVVGSTSTEGIVIGSEVTEQGDWTGPAAARIVLRDKKVELAILETARGGILRRGLAIDACDAAMVTNVGYDHVGVYGIDDLTSMTQVKGVVAQVVRDTGTVVLNARDPNLVAFANSLAAPVTFFADLDAADEVAAKVIARHRASGGAVVVALGGEIVCARGHLDTTLLRVDEVPITFAGAARYNVENVLGVVAVARALGLGDEAIVRGLRGFGMSDNPGRGELVVHNGVRVLLDFGHNPDGVRAVLQMVATLRSDSPGRLTVITGSAGDRSDHDIEEIARALWEARPDRVLVRELPNYLRGRVLGEVSAVFRRALLGLGLAEGAFAAVDTEVDALRYALSDARPGDVVALFVHVDRDEVRAFLSSPG